MNVVHLLAPADYGGLESVVLTLCRGLSAEGDRAWVVPILPPASRESPFVRACREAGLSVEPLVVGGRAYREERAHVARLLRSLEAQVVHTHGYRPDVVDGPVVRRSGLPLVTTVHGFTRHGVRGRLYEWLQVRSFRRFDAVVSVSRPLTEELERRGVPRTVLHTIPNAWAAAAPPLPRAEARALLSLPPDAVVIGWVGRMSVEKAPDVMLQAFARLEDRAAHLCFIGDGPLQASLRAESSRPGLEGRVHHAGRREAAGRLLAAFDVLALSSRTEGTPIVLLEAMAAGVPVVATAVGGIPDVVSEREAYLVPGPDAGALAGALGRALARPSEAAARAERALRRLGTDFAVAPWVGRYRTLYRSLVEGR